MTRIECHRNQGYSWYQKDNIFAKGYLFDRDGNYLEGIALTDYFSCVENEDSFLEKIGEASGLFSIIIQRDGITLFSVDRIRMFPLFWHARNGQIIVTDEPTFLRENIGIPIEQGEVRDDFLTFGYVTGNKTLLTQVYQLKAGEYGVISSNGLKLKTYDNLLSNKSCEVSAKDAGEELLQRIKKSFFQITEQAAGRQIVVPLSGGYDSRLIAVMLKSYGYKNVFCFTYGRRNNPEAKRSEEVAKKLGYPWLMIEYNTELVLDFLNDEIFNLYVLFASSYCAQFFFQEYFAVKYLHDKKIIASDALFLPGHSGDFLAGSHLFQVLNKPLKNKTLAKWLWYKHAVLIPGGNRKKSFVENLTHRLKEEEFPSYLVYENWDWQERQAKYIVNSTSVYNFFGYKHVLPMWHKEWFEFFKCLPFELRYHKSLYDAVCEQIFKAFDVHFEDELQPLRAQLQKQEQKEQLKKRFYPLTRILKKFKAAQPDDHYYYELTKVLAEDLKIHYIDPMDNPSNKNALVAQWNLYKLLNELD